MYNPHPVAMLTGIMTSAGSASGAVTHRLRATAGGLKLLLTPRVEAERLARESREAFLSARIKTGSTLWN
jgi:hypothetical protein